MSANSSSMPFNVHRRESEAGLADFERPQLVAPDAHHTPHPKILLADDDPGVRGSLSNVLTVEGFEVIPAIDGQHALELSRAMPVDLVLLDLNMPRKNGWDTFERLSAELPLVPVIIVTARPNQLFTALGAGAGALLEKPLDIPTLVRTIRRLLEESAEMRLARLAGRAVPFHYAAPSHSKMGN